eukprot:scaffold31939_cov61-Phaeocystis_antarctica.AAC.1
MTRPPKVKAEALGRPRARPRPRPAPRPRTPQTHTLYAKERYSTLEVRGFLRRPFAPLGERGSALLARRARRATEGAWRVGAASHHHGPVRPGALCRVRFHQRLDGHQPPQQAAEARRRRRVGRVELAGCELLRLGLLGEPGGLEALPQLGDDLARDVRVTRRSGDLGEPRERGQVLGVLPEQLRHQRLLRDHPGDALHEREAHLEEVQLAVVVGHVEVPQHRGQLAQLGAHPLPRRAEDVAREDVVAAGGALPHGDEGRVARVEQ